MINLIPSFQKRKLFLERIKKMVVILWFLVSFFIICLALVLFSVRIYISSQLQSEQAFVLQSKKEINQAKVEDFRQRVDLINSQIKKVDDFFEERIYFIDVLEKISSVLPNEIYLKEASLIFDSDNNIKVSLQGFSPDRESLFNFREILEEKKEFSNIFFPPSNWIEKYNINFSVNFEIKND